MNTYKVIVNIDLKTFNFKVVAGTRETAKELAKKKAKEEMGKIYFLTNKTTIQVIKITEIFTEFKNKKYRFISKQ